MPDSWKKTQGCERMIREGNAIDSRRAFHMSVIAIVLLGVMSIYAYYYFALDGRHYVSVDGAHYLRVAAGEGAKPPFNMRILKPKAAALMAFTAGIPRQVAFQILTPIELLLSLVLLLIIAGNFGVTRNAQCVIVAVFGCGMSVIFGRAPVLVDTLLLLLACSFTILALKNYFGAAFACVCLAILTKEYGCLLGGIWSLEMLERGRVSRAIWGAVATLALLFVNKRLTSPSADVLASGFGEMFVGAVKYTLSGLTGQHGYKMAYYWLWASVWPLMLVAFLNFAGHLVQHGKIAAEHIGFSVMLAAMPFLLTGDWDRSFMIVVPFAITAAAGHELLNDKAGLMFFLAGGLSAAISRPVVEAALPSWLRAVLILISLSSSVLLLARIAGYYFQYKLPWIPGYKRKRASE